MPKTLALILGNFIVFEELSGFVTQKWSKPHLPRLRTIKNKRLKEYLRVLFS